MHISRATTPDAYELTIELAGASPQDVQVRAQGQSILISRESSTQQVQKDSFGNGRGYTRSFSYSSGTSSRRLRVPQDADLSAMSRTDAESSVVIRIPRVSR
jgi:HSP20 family molecular chaperone IbpA